MTRVAIVTGGTRGIGEAISLALKELRESVHWLSVGGYSDFLCQKQIRPLIAEGRELSAILTASQRTARTNASK